MGLGFVGHDRVLDAGCGFGQWSLALAEINGHVDATDIDEFRCQTVEKLHTSLCLDNLSIRQGSILEIPYDDATFDAVHCYGTIFLVDWRAALAELTRVTRPGGVLYCSAVGIGWYLHNLLNSHNDSLDYSSRRMAVRSLWSTLAYHSVRRQPAQGAQLSIAPRVLRRELRRLGFEDIKLADDGRAGSWQLEPPPQFFAGKRYGLPCGFEALAYKRH
jgi:SAM-dependent methyltransferase